MITADSAVDIPGATSCDMGDFASVLATSCPRGVRIHPGSTDIGVVHRRTADLDVYLVINTGPSVRAFTLSPRSVRRSYEEWDAETGQVRRTGQPGGGVDVTLHPYQSTVIALSDREPAESDAGRDDQQGDQRRVVLDDGWHVQFAGQGSGVDVDLPHVWENDPEHLAFSGSGPTGEPST